MDPNITLLCGVFAKFLQLWGRKKTYVGGSGGYMNVDVDEEMDVNEANSCDRRHTKGVIAFPLMHGI